MEAKKVTDSANDAFETLKSKQIVDKNAVMSEHQKWQVLVSSVLFK